MRGGVLLARARRAVVPTCLARDLVSRPEAGQISDDGSNALLAQRALHARGGFGVKGRIAKCPRLQQIGQIT
jgi:hypothetical protein